MPEEFPLTFLIVQLASGELSQLLFSGKKKRRTSFCLHFWSIEFQVDSYLFHPAPTPIFKDVAPLPLGKHSFRKQVCCYFYLYPVCIILLFFLWILLRSTLCHGYIGLWFWCVFRCFTFCLFCMSFDEIFGYVKNMRFLSVWEKNQCLFLQVSLVCHPFPWNHNYSCIGWFYDCFYGSHKHASLPWAHPYLWNLWIPSLHGERDFTGVTMLRTLRWKDFLDFLGGPSIT